MKAHGGVPRWAKSIRQLAFRLVGRRCYHTLRYEAGSSLVEQQAWLARDSSMTGAYSVRRAAPLPLLILALAIGSVGASDLTPPNWTALFNADGTLKDEVNEVSALVSNGVPDVIDYGGFGAMFVEDNISADVALDMSALAGSPALETSYVLNRIVSSPHDLGNVYAFGTFDATGNRVVYAGVERLSPAKGGTGATYVEFELNQAIIQVPAVDAAIRGYRMPGDLLVRMNLLDGDIESVQFYQWEVPPSGGTGAYQTFEISNVAPGPGCGGVPGVYLYCIGEALSGLAPTNSDVWDSNGDLVIVPTADSFLQVGINLAQLLGLNTEFTSLVLRTSEDVVFAYLQGDFRSIGYWNDYP